MSARRFILLALLGICLLARPQLAAAAEDDLGEDDELAEEAPAEDAPAEDAPAEAEGEGQAAAEGGEGAAAVGPSEADTGRTLYARAAFGGGVGTRSVQRPISGGEQRLPTAVFPAADLGLAVRLWPDAAFAFDIALRYQTSLGLTIEEHPIFALSNMVDVRAEHIELGVAPSWRLSDSSEATRFGVPVGMALRNFWPAVHQLLTPRYTLYGPFVRVELDVPLGNVARLRLAPEAQLFFIAGTDLTNYGVSSPGFAVGAEASLQFRLSERFLIELRYRQSNALASTATDASFLDVERFGTVSLAGEM